MWHISYFVNNDYSYGTYYGTGTKEQNVYIWVDIEPSVGF